MSALRARAFPVLLGALVLPSVGGLRPAFEDHVGTRVETEQRFEMVKSLMQTYSSQGRLLDRQRVNRSSVSLDFEIELKGSRLETIAPAEIEDLLPDLQRWLRKVNACGSQRRCLLPRPTSTAASSTVAPAVHFTQRRSVESWNAPETVQFTIGLDLSKVFRWLKLSPFHQRYDSGHRCDHPKALMQPYLVRSHWGDMLTVLSPTERERFASDVLKVVAQQGIPLEADAPLWKQNFYDYLKSMARKVLLQRRRVDRRVSSRSCGFHGRTTGARFTARKWLEAALQGQDRSMFWVGQGRTL
eukprot:g6175.t1